MAKYLGGINNPVIDVVDLSKCFLSVDFDLKFYDYNGESFGSQTMSIGDHIIRYEEITSEKNRSSDYSLTWGLPGILPVARFVVLSVPYWEEAAKKQKTISSFANWITAGNLPCNWIRMNSKRGSCAWTLR